MAPDPTRPAPAIEAALQEAVDEGVTPAAVLACGRIPGPRHRVVVGRAAVVPRPRPVHATTLFDLASLTKVLATGWLAMKWWEEGHLDLDAPLQDLLPGYYPPDKHDLTVRLLMCHAAGLPAGLRLFEQGSRSPAAVSRGAIVERFLVAPIEAEPGTRTLYSDIGPILVGDLLEQLGSRRLDHACAEELYGPAGLEATCFVHLDAPLPGARRPPEDFAATEDCQWRGRVVVGEVHDESAWLLRGVAGHAGLFAPVADLERLARAFLGAGGDPRVRTDTLCALTSPQHVAPNSSRAFGWDTARPGGPGGSRLSSRAYGHTGFTGTSLWIDPAAGLYVVLLTNRVHPSRDETRLLGLRGPLHDLVVESLTDAAT